MAGLNVGCSRESLRGMASRLVLTVLAVICCCVCSYAADTDKPEYERFLKMRNEDLIDLSERYLSQDSMRSKAAEVLSVVTRRYYENPSDTAVRHSAVIAMRHLGNLQMSYDIDYRKAYRNLRTAQQIAEEDANNYQLSYIYNSLANLYHWASSGKDENNMGPQLLIDAADAALKSCNQDMMPIIALNMVSVSDGDSTLWHIYEGKIRDMLCREFSPGYEKAAEMVSHIVKSKEAILSGDVAAAENELLTANNVDIDDNYAERYHYAIVFMLLKIYKVSGQDEKALALLRTSLSEAVVNRHRDYELSLYKRIADIYESMNNIDSMETYTRRYQELENSFHNDKGFKNIEVINLIDEIDRINKEVEMFSFRQQEERRKRVVVISVLVVVIIALTAMVWIYINLRRNHRNLFLRNEEMIKREQSHQLVREKLLSDNKNLSERLKQLEPTINQVVSETVQKAFEKAAIYEESESSGDDDINNEANGNENLEALEETCDNGVADEQQLRLYTSILRVMEESDTIYNPGFSLKDLSALLGVPSRAVSRAINVCHNANFHTFLNEYRIREVTRLMHDLSTTNLTIESIAEQAGFKSRSSFSHLFKKTTGLTPTEYLKMARSRR